MRRNLFLLLFLLAGMMASLAVHAQPNKCIGADGKITYTDAHCPSGSKSPPAAAVTPGNSPYEEFVCAAKWFTEHEEFRAAMGIRERGPDSDKRWDNDLQKLVPLPTGRRPAYTSINFKTCEKYSIVRPSGMVEYSRNQWSAVRAWCKTNNTSYAQQVKAGLRSRPVAGIGGSLTETEAAGNVKTSQFAWECAEYDDKYPTAAVLESELRKKYEESTPRGLVDVIQKPPESAKPSYSGAAPAPAPAAPPAPAPSQTGSSRPR